MGIVVVTGATGALGGAVVDDLLRRGHAVAAVGRPAAHDRLAALAASYPQRCAPITLDVARADREAWSTALGQIDAALGGPPDGAVLTAGGWRGGAPLYAEADDTIVREMFDANFETAQKTLRALLPGMVARRRGSIVVVGSRAVERPWASAGAAAYGAAKSALVALSRIAAAEVLDSGVRVNAVLPSTIDTPQNRRAMPDADASRWVPPSSIAAVVAFLLSDDARDVSGAVVPVYGRA